MFSRRPGAVDQHRAGTDRRRLHIFLSHGPEFLAIDAATFAATPVVDPGGALSDEMGLVVVGPTLYVLVADYENYDFVHVVMVDVATRTVVGTIQVATATGAQEVVFPIRP